MQVEGRGAGVPFPNPSCLSPPVPWAVRLTHPLSASALGVGGASAQGQGHGAHAAPSCPVCRGAGLERAERAGGGVALVRRRPAGARPLQAHQQLRPEHPGGEELRGLAGERPLPLPSLRQGCQHQRTCSGQSASRRSASGWSASGRSASGRCQDTLARSCRQAQAEPGGGRCTPWW